MSISDKMKEEISSLFDAEISDDTEFVKDLNATSMNYMFMIGTIEDLTGKSVSYSKMKACTTVADACALCENLVA